LQNDPREKEGRLEMTSKNTHELRMLATVTILTGTLVIGLQQFSRESVTNTVRLAQSSSFSTQRSLGTEAERDARDRGRMDMRQQGSLPGPSNGQVRSAVPPSGTSGAVMEYDSRRDNSRMDNRHQMAPPTAPRAQAAAH
jgi:hypothetical protein